MDASTGGGIWYEEDGVTGEMCDEHHKPEWGRMPHACELAHAPYTHPLLEDQDALTHASIPLDVIALRIRTSTACTTCSLSCVTSVLPDYTVSMLLLLAVSSVPMGSSSGDFIPMWRSRKGERCGARKPGNIVCGCHTQRSLVRSIFEKVGSSSG